MTNCVARQRPFNTAIKFASTGVAGAGANEADHWAIARLFGTDQLCVCRQIPVHVQRPGKDFSSRFARNASVHKLSLRSRQDGASARKTFFPKGGIFDDVKIRAGWDNPVTNHRNKLPVPTTLAAYNILCSGHRKPNGGARTGPINLAPQCEMGDRHTIRYRY